MSLELTPATKEAAISFVYREARLLDEGRFEEWIELFAEDGLYWAPLEEAQTDSVNVMSIYRDNKTMLRARIERMRHPNAHADVPPPRTLHALSNLEVLSRDDGGISVRSALIMAEWRDQSQTCYYARVSWTLEAVAENDFRIKLKRVDLINCDAFHRFMTIPF